ncbi:MAG TPA: hypothetical protein VFL82_14575, partial [Thermomicrobiales bacterium]|nr:hypothetical protein [Thermomicrobiales bacterium]
AGNPHVTSSINANPEDFPAPMLYVRPIDGTWQPPALRDQLAAGTPSIHVNAEGDVLIINTHGLQPGDEAIILRRLNDLLPTAGDSLTPNAQQK